MMNATLSERRKFLEQRETIKKSKKNKSSDSVTEWNGMEWNGMEWTGVPTLSSLRAMEIGGDKMMIFVCNCVVDEFC